jgi:hypothetical protein
MEPHFNIDLNIPYTPWDYISVIEDDFEQHTQHVDWQLHK